MAETGVEWGIDKKISYTRSGSGVPANSTARDKTARCREDRWAGFRIA
jgi:hypothetical protein